MSSSPLRCAERLAVLCLRAAVERGRSLLPAGRSRRRPRWGRLARERVGHRRVGPRSHAMRARRRNRSGSHASALSQRSLPEPRRAREKRRCIQRSCSNVPASPTRTRRSISRKRARNVGSQLPTRSRGHARLLPCQASASGIMGRATTGVHTKRYPSAPGTFREYLRRNRSGFKSASPRPRTCGHGLCSVVEWKRATEA